MVHVSKRTNYSSLAFVCCIFGAVSLNQVDAFQQPFAANQVPNGRGISDLNHRSPPKSIKHESMRSATSPTSMNLFSKRSTAPSSKISLSARLLQMKAFLFRMLNIFRPKSTKQWLIAGTIFLASFFSPPAMARTSGGRIGGTYSRPSRPTMSRPAAPSRPHRRPLPPKKHYHYPRTYPRYRTSSPVYHPPVGYSTTTIVESPYMREIHPRKVRAGDLILWTGVGLAVSTGVRRHFEQQHDSRSVDQSPLGPGATAAFLTVALQVPDRNSPSSLLKSLESKAMSANTETRQGLQQVVSEVSLELLRKDSTIVSVGTSIQHFGSVRSAQVAFQKASIMNRSKLDRESGKNKLLMKHTKKFFTSYYTSCLLT
mmetsp:Transcript_18400/g.45610  ORF Transcript_18400/g.45610 Transcript_18400/m.45610 type:complete len:370 (-) Transcript_18400:424-1533(-)